MGWVHGAILIGFQDYYSDTDNEEDGDPWDSVCSCCTGRAPDTLSQIDLDTELRLQEIRHSRTTRERTLRTGDDAALTTRGAGEPGAAQAENGDDDTPKFVTVQQKSSHISREARAEMAREREEQERRLREDQERRIREDHERRTRCAARCCSC